MHETWLIVLLSMLYGGVLALALSEWVRHPGARYLNRWVWLLIVLLFSLVGPLAYLLLGKERSGRAVCDVCGLPQASIPRRGGADK